MNTSCAGPLPPGPAVNRPSRNLGGTFFFMQNMNINQLHPLAMEVVHRIHRGEPADRIIEALRQDRRLPVGVTVAIRELANAERRLERLRDQARQAEADAERLAAELNEAVLVADAAKLLATREVRR